LDILNYYFWAATVPSRAANDRSAIQVLADLIRIQALSKVSLMSGGSIFEGPAGFSAIYRFSSGQARLCRRILLLPLGSVSSVYWSDAA